MSRAPLQARLEAALDSWREKHLPEKLKSSLEVYLGDSQGRLYPSPDSAQSSQYIYQIASMTKPLTSLAAILLWEEGKFQLEDPVSDYIPEFAHMNILHKQSRTKGLPDVKAAHNKIRIIHLFTHTSGIAYPFLHKGIRAISQYLGGTQIDKDLAAHQSYWAELPLLHEPGEGWTYGLSTDILGRLVEIVSGKSFSQFLKERIFEPLRMLDTGFSLAESKWPRLAPRWHQGTLGGYMSQNQRSPRAYTYTSPGGGLYSSCEDYAHFLQMLLCQGIFDGKKIISEKTIPFLLENHIASLTVQEEQFPFLEEVHQFSLMGMRHTGPTPQYPLSQGSLSWLGSSHTAFWLDPSQDLFGIFMSQITPFPGEDVFDWYKELQLAVYGVL